MQSAAFSARRALLRPLHRQCYRQYSSVPPKEPFQGYGGRKRAVVITIAFLTGASSYFIFVPDPSRHAPTFDAAPLSPRYFSPSTVVSNEPSGPDTKLLKLAIQPEVLKATDQKGDSFSAIWSVFIKDDDIQVERPYTPLYGIDEEGQLSFWIKKYPNGEVGRWLHSKKSGEKIEFRGPLSTWNWKSDTWDEVVMVRLEYTHISFFFPSLLHRYPEERVSHLSTNSSTLSSPTLQYPLQPALRSSIHLNSPKSFLLPHSSSPSPILQLNIQND